MTNSKNTKKSLYASALALLLCFVMLIGTTFAWFTDSASTGVNKIQAGNLNIDVLVKNVTEDENAYASIKGQDTVLFGEDILWEPGYVAAKHIKVTTTGNLALKYTLSIGAEGAVGPLAKVIDVYYAPSELTMENRDAINQLNKLGTLEDVLTGKVATVNDTLIPEENDSDYATLALKMQETAGNEYKEAFAGAFTLNVVATQLAYENDSFNNQYDNGAVYPIVNQTQFNEALTEAKEGDTVRLSNMTYKLDTSLPAGVSIVGEGADSTTIDAGNGIAITNKNVTVKDVTVKNTGSAPVIKIENGANAVVSGVKIEDAKGHGIQNYIGANDLLVENSNISCDERAVFNYYSKGDITVKNSILNALYPISIMYDNYTDVNLLVEDSVLNGWTSFSAITSAKFINTSFGFSHGYGFCRPYSSTVFENCDFATGFEVGCGTEGITYTFENCRLNGVLLTAENIADLLDETEATPKVVFN